MVMSLLNAAAAVLLPAVAGMRCCIPIESLLLLLLLLLLSMPLSPATEAATAMRMEWP